MSMVSNWLLGIAEQAFPFDFDKQDELQAAFLDGDMNRIRRLMREAPAEGQQAIQRGMKYWNRNRRASQMSHPMTVRVASTYHEAQF